MARNSSAKSIAHQYQQNKDMNLFGKERDELFVEILKNIIIENAENAKSSGAFNFDGTVAKITYAHGLFPMCFKDRQGNLYSDMNMNKFVDSVTMNFEHWISGWSYPEKQIRIGEPTKKRKSSYITSDRALLIDFLLYYNYKHYQGNSYIDNRKSFDATLDKLGYGRLNITNYQELCVLSAFRFSKPEEDIYAVFASLYNNSDLKQIIEESTEDEIIEESEKYTNYIELVFNKVTHIGSKEDAICIQCDKDISLFNFVEIFKNVFGRARLSSLRLLCELILGKKLDDRQLIKNDWSQISMEKTEALVRRNLTHNQGDLKKLFNEMCKSTFAEFLESYEKKLISQRICDYNAEMQSKRSSDPLKTFTIFDLWVAKAECIEFLKLQGINVTNPIALEDDVKQKWHDECKAYFFAETPKGAGRNKKNQWIKLKENDMNAVWDAYFFREQSVTKESMVWALILCLRSDVLKGMIGDQTIANNQRYTAEKIMKKLNKLLHSIGMSALNEHFSEGEFLLNYAIKNVDYSEVFSAQRVYYPYRKYVFDEILSNLSASQTLEQINRIEEEFSVN